MIGACRLPPAACRLPPAELAGKAGPYQGHWTG
jgi:hypothetical protein